MYCSQNGSVYCHNKLTDCNTGSIRSMNGEMKVEYNIVIRESQQIRLIRRSSK